MTRADRRQALVIGLALCCALACSALAGCGGATARHTTAPHATRVASPAASSSPTSSGTATATATDIPLAVLTGATLGGTTTGISATYGASSGSNSWDAHGTSFTITLATGTDGLPHVAGVAAHQSGGSAWTQARAQQACAAFLPPDAVHQRDTTTTSGDQEAVYLSGQLGSTFLPSAFGDQPPGTLVIDYAPSAGGVARCMVVPGVL